MPGSAEGSVAEVGEASPGELLFARMLNTRGVSSFNDFKKYK